MLPTSLPFLVQPNLSNHSQVLVQLSNGPPLTLYPEWKGDDRRTHEYQIPMVAVTRHDGEQLRQLSVDMLRRR